MVPGVFLISSAVYLDRMVLSGEVGVAKLLYSLSNIGSSYSHSHALAYKSSCLMTTSGSGCHSRGVIGMSGIGWRGVNCRSFIRRRICVLLVPISRTKELLFGNTFSIPYGPIQRKCVKGILLPWRSAFGCNIKTKSACFSFEALDFSSYYALSLI